MIPTLSRPEREICSYLRAGAGCEGLLVVLRAPGGELAVDANLAAKNAGDAALHGARGARTARRVERRERRALRSRVAQHFQRVRHGMVVERDVGVVTLAEQEKLRPAAVLVLGGKQVIDTALDRRLIARVRLQRVDAGDELQLAGRRTVIDRRLRFVLRDLCASPPPRPA